MFAFPLQIFSFSISQYNDFIDFSPLTTIVS